MTAAIRGSLAPYQRDGRQGRALKKIVQNTMIVRFLGVLVADCLMDSGSN